MGNICSNTETKHDPFDDPKNMQVSEESVEPIGTQPAQTNGEELNAEASGSPSRRKSQYPSPRLETIQSKNDSWDVPPPATEVVGGSDNDLQDIDVKLEEVTELSEIPSDTVSPRQIDTAPSTPRGGTWKPAAVLAPADSSPIACSTPTGQQSANFVESSSVSAPKLTPAGRSSAQADSSPEPAREGSISDLSDPGEYETYGTESSAGSPQFSAHPEESPANPSPSSKYIRVNPMFSNPLMEEDADQHQQGAKQDAGTSRYNDVDDSSPEKQPPQAETGEGYSAVQAFDSQDNWDDSAPASPVAEAEPRTSKVSPVWEGIWDVSQGANKVVKSNVVEQDRTSSKELERRITRTSSGSSRQVPSTDAATVSQRGSSTGEPASQRESWTGEATGQREPWTGQSMKQGESTNGEARGQRESSTGEPTGQSESGAGEATSVGDLDSGDIQANGVYDHSSERPSGSLKVEHIGAAAPLAVSPIIAAAPSTASTAKSKTSATTGNLARTDSLEKGKSSKPVPSYMQGTKSSQRKYELAQEVSPSLGKHADAKAVETDHKPRNARISGDGNRNEYGNSSKHPHPPSKTSDSAYSRSKTLPPKKSPGTAALVNSKTLARDNSAAATAVERTSTAVAMAPPIPLVSAQPTTPPPEPVKQLTPAETETVALQTAATSPVASEASKATNALAPLSSSATPTAVDVTPSEAPRKPAPKPAAGGLPPGQWRLVRLKKAMPCDAHNGTIQQETVDGDLEVFKCDVTLVPGGLAAVCAHEIELPDGTTKPKTWVFCPDPLCLDSKPVGSSLPKWPSQFQLEGATKITRSEYATLKELGVDIVIPSKAPGPTSG